MTDRYFDDIQNKGTGGDSQKREVIKASWRPVIEHAIQKEKSHPDMVPPPDIQDRIVHIRQSLVTGKAFTFLIFTFITFVGSIYMNCIKELDVYLVYGASIMLGLVSGIIGLFNFFHERKLKDSTEKRGVKRLIAELYFDTLKSVKTVYRFYWILLAAAITVTVLKYPPLMQLFGQIMQEIEKMILLFTKTKVALQADEILLSWLVALLLFTVGDFCYVRFITREVRRADSA